MKNMLVDNFYVWLVVPILFEPFPVSSSGHAIALQRLASLLFPHTITFSYASAYLQYIVHGPIFLVVGIYFFKQILSFLITMWATKQLWYYIFWFMIVGAGTALWYYIFASYTITIPLYIGNFITAVLLLSLYFLPEQHQKQEAVPVTSYMTILSATVLGMSQGLALLPGISRLGATFVVARWLSFPAAQAFFISFLIELPISAAACIKGLYKVYYVGQLYKILNPLAILIMVGASAGAYIGLHGMYSCVQHNFVWIFGLYMLCAGFVTYWFMV